MICGDIDEILKIKKQILGDDPLSRIGFTNGCFDILHAGHVQYLQECCQVVTHLFVAVNDDESVEYLKGPGRPILSQRHRCLLIDSLKFVNITIPFTGNRVTHLLEAITPHVFIKGGDYNWDSIHPDEQVAVEHIRCDIHFPKLEINISTSDIIKKIQKLDYGTN